LKKRNDAGKSNPDLSFAGHLPNQIGKIKDENYNAIHSSREISISLIISRISPTLISFPECIGIGMIFFIVMWTIL